MIPHIEIRSHIKWYDPDRLHPIEEQALVSVSGRKTILLAFLLIKIVF